MTRMWLGKRVALAASAVGLAAIGLAGAAGAEEPGLLSGAVSGQVSGALSGRNSGDLYGDLTGHLPGPRGPAQLVQVQSRSVTTAPGDPETTPAKAFFGAVKAPKGGDARVYGGYSRGCLSGGRTLEASGPGWQVMRPSRNRNHGHPELLAFVHRLAGEAQEIGWPGLLIGDMAQPAGGPMLTGHRSHQVGLDVDIWMRPAPERELDLIERESLGSESVVAAGGEGMSKYWTATHREVLQAAASDPSVARIFVNAAVKKALCEATAPQDAAWLRKIRPWWGHDHHFHVRLNCPAGSPDCKAQAAPPAGAGCGASLDWWFSEDARTPKPRAQKGPLKLSDLPTACRTLVDGG